MELKPALKVDDPDNVATIFANGIVDGTEVEVRDKKGNSEIIRVHGDVPYGHKIALKYRLWLWHGHLPGEERRRKAYGSVHPEVPRREEL